MISWVGDIFLRLKSGSSRDDATLTLMKFRLTTTYLSSRLLTVFIPFVEMRTAGPIKECQEKQLGPPPRCFFEAPRLNLSTPSRECLENSLQHWDRTDVQTTL